MNKENCFYNLSELPESVVLLSAENRDDKNVVKWSGLYPIPQIGDKVYINFNQLGSGVVESYFVEHSYMGLTVKLDNAPEWHRKQTKGQKWEGKAMVFGQEINVQKAHQLEAL
jgi:hypothetical protein